MKKKWTIEKITTLLAPYLAWLKANVKKSEKWDDGLKWAYSDVKNACDRMPKVTTDSNVERQIKILNDASMTTGIEKTGFPVKSSAKWDWPAHAKAAAEIIEKSLRAELMPKKFNPEKNTGFLSVLSHRRTQAKKDDKGNITKPAGRFFRERAKQRDTKLNTFMQGLKADLQNGDWDGTINGLKTLADLPEGVTFGE